jgi:hypothetical protein
VIVGRVLLNGRVAEVVGAQVAGLIGISSVDTIVIVCRLVEYETSVGHAVAPEERSDGGIVAFSERVGKLVEPLPTASVPVGRKTVEFPNGGAVVGDDTALPVKAKPVEFIEAAAKVLDAVPAGEVTFVERAGTADEAVPPVGNALVELDDGVRLALKPVPIGKLAFTESVGTLEDGAATPVTKKPVKFADSVGIATDPVSWKAVKPPESSSSSDTVADAVSSVRNGAVKLAEGVGKALTPVPTTEVAFVIADRRPVDAGAPVKSTGVEIGPEAVPIGALELADNTGMMADATTPVESGIVTLAEDERFVTGAVTDPPPDVLFTSKLAEAVLTLTVELSERAGTEADPVPIGTSKKSMVDGIPVLNDMGALEFADSLATALAAVRGGSVMFAVGTGVESLIPETRDRERERPIRSSSSGLYVPTVEFTGIVKALKFAEIGGEVIEGCSVPTVDVIFEVSAKAGVSEGIPPYPTLEGKFGIVVAGALVEFNPAGAEVPVPIGAVPKVVELGLEVERTLPLRLSPELLKTSPVVDELFILGLGLRLAGAVVVELIDGNIALTPPVDSTMAVTPEMDMFRAPDDGGAVPERPVKFEGGIAPLPTAADEMAVSPDIVRALIL